MLRTGIEQFVGFWVSESGYRLRIRKVRKDQAFVDFLDPRGAPIARPYMGGSPFDEDGRALRRLQRGLPSGSVGGGQGVDAAFGSRVRLRSGLRAARSA